MSWLLFLDESGHDHRNTPYEVRGGITLHDSKLWPFMQALRSLEQAVFGTLLHEHGSEIKGSKLLSRDRFKWDKQGPKMDDASRRKHALNFLNSSAQKRAPRQEEFTAFGQASLQFTEHAILLMRGHDVRVFATIIPCDARPSGGQQEILRKDIVFLLERYFYFLEDQREPGLIVMDQTDKLQDQKFVRQLNNYFSETATGKARTRWIVPVPFFVDSDMAAGVQMADLSIYMLNWGYRLRRMTAPVREEIRDYANLLEPLIWHAKRAKGEKLFDTHSVVYVPDPYVSRKQRPNEPQK